MSWKDSSWGYDFLLGIAYRLLGLRAVPVAAMLLKIALAITMFLLARAGRSGFWESVALAALGQYAIDRLLPLPYACSIVLFALELAVLLRCRQGGNTRSLFWLPLLFVIWVNLHSLFVFGLVLLVLFMISDSVERRLRGAGVKWISSRIVHPDTKTVGLVAGLSFAATLVNPYTYRLFPVALKTAYSSVSFKYFGEMHALAFRRPQDYVLLLLVMTAFLSLGRLRSLELFELVALLCVAGVAFRIQRDSWLAVLLAIALCSSGIPWLQKQREPATGKACWPNQAWVAALSTAAMLAGIISLPRQEALISKLSKTMPVKACDYIRAHQLPGPIFNAYTFGSFLTWYLPEYPVVIDSRLELYGNAKTDDYFQAVSGNRRIEDAPILARAGTLLLEKESGLRMALTTFPVLEARYQEVYSDDIASVFVTLPLPTPEN